MSTLLTSQQWDALPLGRMDDGDVCRLAHARHGVWPSLVQVAAERVRRGIPEYVHVPPVELPAPADLGLSADEPDEVAAARLGRPVSEIRALRRGQGTFRRRPFDEEDKTYFRQAYVDGVPVETIAAKLGRSAATIYQTARGWGLSRPGGSGTRSPKRRAA